MDIGVGGAVVHGCTEIGQAQLAVDLHAVELLGGQLAHAQTEIGVTAQQTVDRGRKLLKQLRRQAVERQSAAEIALHIRVGDWLAYPCAHFESHGFSYHLELLYVDG